MSCLGIMAAYLMVAAITAKSKSWKWHVAGPGCITYHQQRFMIRCLCYAWVLDLRDYER